MLAGSVNLRRYCFMRASRKDPSKPGTKKQKTHGQSISISYDREADVLSLIFDKSTKAEADEIGPGVYARYAWQTGRLAEVCIVGFSRRFHKKPREIKVPISPWTQRLIGAAAGKGKAPTDKEVRRDYLDYLEA